MNYLGLNQKRTKEVTDQLNVLLADFHVYYQNLRNFHWNVKGPHFFSLHEKFEEMYNDTIDKIDEIAERILTLKQRPVSDFSEYLHLSDIKEAGNIENAGEMVEVILKNHSILINHLRETLQVAGSNSDEGTVDLIGGYLADIEKLSWMMDAWLQKSGEKQPSLT